VKADCFPRRLITPCLLVAGSSTESILNFTFLGTLPGEGPVLELPFLSDCEGNFTGSRKVLICVSLSKVFVLFVTEVGFVCCVSGWLLLEINDVELAFLLLGFGLSCRHSITALSATLCSCSSKFCLVFVLLLVATFCTPVDFCSLLE